MPKGVLSHAPGTKTGIPRVWGYSPQTVMSHNCFSYAMALQPVDDANFVVQQTFLQVMQFTYLVEQIRRRGLTAGSSYELAREVLRIVLRMMYMAGLKLHLASRTKKQIVSNPIFKKLGISPQAYRVAVLAGIGPGDAADFHFAREKGPMLMDSVYGLSPGPKNAKNSHWTHKAGSTPVSGLDSYGAPIPADIARAAHEGRFVFGDRVPYRVGGIIWVLSPSVRFELQSKLERKGVLPAQYGDVLVTHLENMSKY